MGPPPCFLLLANTRTAAAATAAPTGPRPSMLRPPRPPTRIWIFSAADSMRALTLRGAAAAPPPPLPPGGAPAVSSASTGKRTPPSA